MAESRQEGGRGRSGAGTAGTSANAAGNAGAGGASAAGLAGAPGGAGATMGGHTPGKLAENAEAAIEAAVQSGSTLAEKAGEAARQSGESAIEGGRQAASEGARQARRGLEHGEAVANAAAERGREGLRQAAQGATSAARTTMEQGAAGARAAIRSGSAVAESMQDVAQIWTHYAQEVMQRTADASQKLLRCSTFSEMVEIQAELVREQFQAFLDQSAKVSEVASRIATRSFDAGKEGGGSGSGNR